MATYSISINERIGFGKSIIAFLQSIPQVVTFEAPKRKKRYESEQYKSLERAYRDMLLMVEGKKKKKSLDEFIEELRKERENELQHCND